ncbi:MAG: PhnD/SsuA/transferrin family substrate-binding protein [Defluviitaleaceae bacterium]|nr:PhnD/SsuA/transferrin family substrate-binding protein [Defluviitaleaceae bacterium]MCL2239535.1 PhnD/SsuA/transferrin family substrate-binding protein [Defluviitaleaceae bacterium]
MIKVICLMAVMAVIFMLGGCGSRADAPELEQPLIRVAALRGPTAMGMLHLMDNHEQGLARNDYTFELLGAPFEVAPLLVRGDVDVAAVPGNLAAVLYNQMDGAVQALAVVTLGVLHIVDTTGEIHSVADLAGRTIFATGQGATPDFALSYVLKQNGLTPGVDVHIEFYAEHAELAALLEIGEADIALLPEPFVSTVMARIPGLRVALDLTEEWDRVQPDYGLIMSVVVGRRDFLEAHPEAVALFMEEYAQSIAFMTENVAEGAQLTVDFGLIPNINIAKSALPRTHMVFLNGDEMKRNLMGFYRVLYEASPASVGGAMPDGDFFFIP